MLEAKRVADEASKTWLDYINLCSTRSRWSPRPAGRSLILAANPWWFHLRGRMVSYSHRTSASQSLSSAI